jgi:[ribosomal protein S18]-alanine N-acetyltransferase
MKPMAPPSTATQAASSPAPAPDESSPRLLALGVQDLDAVLAIEQGAYSHPWSRGNFSDALASGYWAQGLWLGQTLTGYCIAMRGVDETHLLNITVKADCQGRGWGRHLLDLLCDWSLAQGAQWLWLEVRETHLRAQRLYLDYGFARVGLRKGYYPSGRGQRENAVVMRLALKAAPASVRAAP